MVTAGVLAAVPLTGVGWKDHRFLFYGADSAGLGIAQLIARACSKGRAAGGIDQDKEPFAHEWEHAAALGGSCSRERTSWA